MPLLQHVLSELLILAGHPPGHHIQLLGQRRDLTIGGGHPLLQCFDVLVAQLVLQFQYLRGEGEEVVRRLLTQRGEFCWCGGSYLGVVSFDELIVLCLFLPQHPLYPSSIRV